MRTYGTLRVAGNSIEVAAEAHVMIRLKNVMPRIDARQIGRVHLSVTPETCRDLDWFMQRYPLAMDDKAAAVVLDGSREYQRRLTQMEVILSPNYQPRAFPMAIPPRDYQARAVEILLRGKALLCADQMGLGKTVTACAAFSDPRTLPALVVCQTHVVNQWQRDFLARFLPAARVHVIKTKKTYDLPEADVYIVTYSKLMGWAEPWNRPFFKLIVFDEVQELRHESSQKWHAAKAVRSHCEFALGLSGTPIHNYGGEIYNVMEVIAPQRLGSRGEFYREWCTYHGANKWLVENPDAFRAWLKESFLMVRRTRADVGLELPAMQRIVQPVPYDAKILDGIRGRAMDLARTILSGQFEASGQAAREMDILLRQTTGIAKAPFVAEFVRLVAQDGDPVLLGGWHHAVYDIWREMLADMKPVMFTGLESPKEKDANLQRFIRGESQLLIMSLRAGSGIDGLQRVCKTAVIGELDWAPAVHEQFLARLFRDGVNAGVMGYFLVADGGSDPDVAATLGLKTQQVTGILDGLGHGPIAQTDPERIKNLARNFLAKHHA